jgi:hypothetical protein
VVDKFPYSATVETLSPDSVFEFFGGMRRRGDAVTIVFPELHSVKGLILHADVSGVGFQAQESKNKLFIPWSSIREICWRDDT